MADAGEDYALQQRKPKSILDLIGSSLSSDASRLGNSLYEAAASLPRVLNAHLGEYQPGMSVQDMPATMKQLPETAMNIVGTPGASVPGVTLNSGLKLPSVLELYHGTAVPKPYEVMGEGFKTGLRDLGGHSSIDPGIATFHANRSISGMKNDALRPRIIPSVGDIRSSLKFPGHDPTDWTSPDLVIGALEQVAREGKPLPRGMLSDFIGAEKQAGGFEKNFIPMLQEKGFDSVYYPHHNPFELRSDPKYNSFMTFKSEQLVPKFSEKGQELIAERGMKPAFRGMGNEPRENWQIPRGILKDYGGKPTTWTEIAPQLVERKHWQFDEARRLADADKMDLVKKFGITPTDPEDAANTILKLAAKHGDIVWQMLDKARQGRRATNRFNPMFKDD